MNDTYWLFVVMVIFTVASPGPGVLMTLDNAIVSGWRAAMHGVLGLALGAAVMAGLSSAGVGLLVRSSPSLFLLLKYCGVSYLFYLAYKTWHRDPGPIGGDTPAAAEAEGARHGLLVRGALLQTSNPKSLMFFLSVLPQVVDSKAEATASPLRLVLAIATYCIALIVIHALYAGLAVKARVWLNQPAIARLLSRVSALVFLAFGVTMLTLKL
jgi:threonine/homoserine/homoserine lactone efflux protein